MIGVSIIIDTNNYSGNNLGGCYGNINNKEKIGRLLASSKYSKSFIK
jgi:hypothetical protein